MMICLESTLHLSTRESLIAYVTTSAPSFGFGDRSPGNMDVTTTKAVAMVLLGAISFIAGMLPMVGMRWCLAAASAVEAGAGGDEGGGDVVASNRRRVRAKRARTLVSCLSCFAGGVILTTCFTHMMPHVVQDVR